MPHPTFSRLAIVAPFALALAASRQPFLRTAPRGCDASSGRLVTGGVDARTCRASDFATSTEVASAESLRAALAAATCASHIAIAAGTYTGDFRLARRCDPTQPILVRATGDATFTGRFVLDGSGLVLSGLHVEGGAIRVSGDHDRVTRNVVRDAPAQAIAASGAYQLIDRNETDSTSRMGIEVLLSGDGAKNYGNRVERNFVHRQIGDGNGHEGIRVLTDSYHYAGAVVAYNLLDSVDVVNEGEAISMKTRGALIRGNTLLHSPHSGFTARLGSDNVYELNYMDESDRGIVIQGDRHIVRNNTLVHAPVRVHAGDGTEDTRGCPGASNATLPNCVAVHASARHVLVTDNAAERVIVGFQFTNSPYPNSYPAEQVRVVRSGPVDLRHQTGTTVEQGTPRGVQGRRLTRDEVGPNAPESAPTAIAPPPTRVDTAANVGVSRAATLCFRAVHAVDTVHTSEELAKALGAASCGSEIVLMDGTYAGAFTLTPSCTGGEPIRMRAAHAQRAILSGTLTLTGMSVEISGLEIRGGEIILAGRSLRVTRNLVTTYHAFEVHAGAVGNRIDHNEFRDTYYFGPVVPLDANTASDILFTLSPHDSTRVADNRIDGNFFNGTMDVQGKPGLRDSAKAVAQGASIYVGTADLLRKNGVYYATHTLVDGNLWSNWRKLSAIEVKSQEMAFRGNVVDARSWAKVLNRNGRKSEWTGNRIEGTVLNLYDDDQYVAGNVAPLIRLFALGTTNGAAEEARGNGVRSAANRALLVGNGGRVVVGDNEGANDLRPVTGVVIEAHQGEIVRQAERGTVIRPTTTRVVPATARLTAADVGLTAPDRSCPR